MIEHFIVKALFAGIGIALATGPIGAVIIWRKMAYFGDAIAHSALLGISFAVLLNINLQLGIMLICLAVSGLLVMLSNSSKLSYDAILGNLAHFSLALGLVLATSLENVRVDLLGYLFGDILAVSNQDLLWVLAVDVVVLIGLPLLWNSLLALTVHKELAMVEGIAVQRVKWGFILLLALVFAIAIQLVGVLLITSLLIIPASCASQWAKSPEQMAILGCGFGCVATLLGIFCSLLFNIATGPAIVIMAALLFLLSVSWRSIFH